MSKNTLADFGLMPVNMGCVQSDPELDQFHPMRWGIDDNGLLAVLNPPSLDLVYQDQHSEPTASGMWVDHHTAFAEFLVDGLEEMDVFEIGGGTGLLAEIVLGKSTSIPKWTILEPWIPSSKSGSVDWVEGWFPQDVPHKSGRLLVATHVLEHAVEPQDFINSCSEYLEPGGTLALSWPNMKKMAERGDLNMLNFEHLHFLPYEVVEKMLSAAGLEVQQVQDFRGHSIFLKATKVGSFSSQPHPHGFTPDRLSSLVSEYEKTLNRVVTDMNKLTDEWNGTVWLFGAHIFSQYLIAKGLNVEKVTGLLDNSTHKQGQRLYGTNLSVRGPSDLEGSESQLILIAAALYEDEILDQLRGIQLKNSKVYTSRVGIHELNSA